MAPDEDSPRPEPLLFNSPHRHLDRSHRSFIAMTQWRDLLSIASAKPSTATNGSAKRSVSPSAQERRARST